MIEFFLAQIDFFFFLYGLSFILIGIICISLSRDRVLNLPWLWLALFGVAHGIHKWLELFGIVQRLGAPSRLSAQVLALLSLLCLVEFGRAGFRNVRPDAPGRWIFLPLLFLPLIGLSSGWNGAAIFCRYSFGIAGAVYCCLILVRTARLAETPGARRALTETGIILGLYVVCFAVFVPAASFFPADKVNDEVFLQLFGFPPQLLKSLLSGAALLHFWHFYRHTAAAPNADRKVLFSQCPTIPLFAILLAGWFLTQLLGNHARREEMHALGVSVKALADNFSYSLRDMERIVVERAGSREAVDSLVFRDNRQAARRELNKCGKGDAEAHLCSLLDVQARSVVECDESKTSTLRNTLSKGQLQEAIQAGERRFFFSSEWSAVTMPVRNQAGRIIGAALVVKEIDRFMALLGRISYAFLVDRGGNILLSNRLDMRQSKLWPGSGGSAAATLDKVLLSREPEDGSIVALNGERFLVAKAAVNGDSLSLFSCSSMDHIELYRLLGIFITLVLFFMVIAFYDKLRRTREFAVQISASEKALQKTNEELETRVRERAAELAKVNNTLRAEIAIRIEAERAIERLSERNAMILQSAGEGICGLDEKGIITFANAAAANMTGWAVGELVGKEQHSLLHHSRPDGRLYPAEECHVYASLRDGKTHRRNDELFWKQDGSSFPVEYTSTPLRSGDKVAGAVVVFRDITERRRTERMLKQSEEKYKNLVESMADMVFLLNPQGFPVYMNDAALRLLRFDANTLTGKPWIDFLHADDRKTAGARVRVVLNTGKPVFDLEVRYVAAGGRILQVLHTLIARRNEQGEIVGIQGMGRDISQNKIADESRKLFLHAIMEASDAVQIVDFGGNMLYANKASEELYGYRAEELIGRSTDILTADHTQCSNVIIPTVMGEGRWSGETTRVRKDGTNVPVWLSASLVKNDKGDPIAVVNIVRDMTERKEAERALRNAHDELEIQVRERTEELVMLTDQLRNLSTHLQDVRERERSLIAREVHDELGQALTALKLDLAWFRKKLPGDQAVFAEKSQSMSELVDLMIQTVKRITAELRPGVLDHLGLTSAIEWQADEFKKRTGISCSVTFAPRDIVLDRERSTTVFRIFQETLTNIMRHARASAVSVKLEVTEGFLVLRIKDNGGGITQDQISDPKSLGLIGMRERVYYWRGELKINSGQGKGTTVTVRIPIHDTGSDVVA